MEVHGEGYLAAASWVNHTAQAPIDSHDLPHHSQGPTLLAFAACQNLYVVLSQDLTLLPAHLHTIAHITIIHCKGHVALAA